MIYQDKNKLIRIYNGEKLQIEAWGRHGLRVRVTRRNRFTEEDWALLPQPEQHPEISVNEDESAKIRNGNILLRLESNGRMVICNAEGRKLLEQYETYDVLHADARELKCMHGGNFRASLKWESDPDEKLYGMGQYQDGMFDLKGSIRDLAQKNTQASVPFLVSNLGYGFLWNNPAVGRATFGKNITTWEAENTKQIDFWVTAGDTPAEILENYMNVTGKPPVMPEHGLGFWQCKLRYQTQEELLTVAREYHRRGIPLDVIIADFFHWKTEGDWSFDPEYWPDPAGMVKELEEMGIKLMVSIWPTVSIHADSYPEMKQNGYLVHSENGADITMLFLDPESFVDVTNPDARTYLWNKVKKNYMELGISDFWLDVAEPEFTCPDYENYRYYKGSAAEVGNEYPAMYTKAFFDGLTAEGKHAVNLVRCAWAGSQRYGALVWSGDIRSTFDAFRKQIVCGLQMAMAGIPWWTTDIGGFFDGDINDPDFRELLIRWFQYGTFCPVMRLHGFRSPLKPPMNTTGGGRCNSGADNEIWSYGEENYEIMKHYIELRNRLRPYTRELMDRSTRTGCPVIRPLFYNFPEDQAVWDIKDEFLFGDDILAAPVTEPGMRQRNVYLPNGADWINVCTGERQEGGRWYTCDAPLEQIPVFVRAERKELVTYFSL